MRVLAVASLTAVLAAPPAAAAWNRTAPGSAAARATALGPGNLPTAAVSGKRVAVAWSASTFTGGGNAPGYIVRRYNATTGALQAVGASCNGTVTTLTCTEKNTPTGDWQYTITPVAANWRGSESGKSAVISV
jgi:hypothetical protein